MRALLLGAGGDGAGVGADVRLGEAEGAEHLAARERLQKARLLLLAAVAGEDARHEVVHGDDGGGGAVARGDLLAGDRHRRVVEARAAPRFRNRNPVEAHCR
jgi:hypothetical protein